MTIYSVPLSYTQPLTFQVTLDESYYTATVYWLYYGQRSYLKLLDSFGNLVVNIALIGSSTTEGVAPVNIIAGYFTTSKLYYYPSDQTMVITP